MALASRLVSERSTTTLWRLPLSFLHTTHYSTAAATANATSTPQNPTKKRKKMKKNLFEVAQFLPNWGIGYHMAKTHWTNVTYEITKINLYKDGRHGKAWGVAYKDGQPAPEPKKISGVHKRCWKYIKNPLRLAAEQKPEQPEVQQSA